MEHLISLHAISSLKLLANRVHYCLYQVAALRVEAFRPVVCSAWATSANDVIWLVQLTGGRAPNRVDRRRVYVNEDSPWRKAPIAVLIEAHVYVLELLIPITRVKRGPRVNAMLSAKLLPVLRTNRIAALTNM